MPLGTAHTLTDGSAQPSVVSSSDRMHIISRAYGSSIVGVFSGLLTAFVLLKLIATRIPQAEFGAYVIASQLAAYLGNFQLGLDFAASRQIAECRGKGELETANQAYWELLRFNRIITVLAAAALAIATPVIVIRSHISGVPPSLVPLVFVGFGCVQMLVLTQRPYSSALIGSEQQVFTNLLTVARTIASTLLASAALLMTPTVLVVPAAEFVTQFAALGLLRRRLRSTCDWFTASRPPRNRPLFRSLLRFGIPATLGGIAWTLESTSDILILGAFNGAAAAAVYVLWWRFPQMLFDFSTRLTTSAFPEFARAHGTSVAHIRGIFDKVAYLSVGIGTLAAIGVALWLPAFMRLWLGTRYLLPNGEVVARLCGTLVLLRVTGNLLSMFQMSTGAVKRPTILAWVQAAVKVGLSILLIPSFGIVGALIASCVAGVVQEIGRAHV